ncbi:MAG: hypothetical protein QOG64_735 [Acidimicrobiaceae bacterium]|nr:hypothetical protein [Acidimicrobiaceae bacterium]
MSGVLDGKAALITGGGSGIGLACARALAADGAAVTIAGRSQARLDQALAELEVEGATAAVCDVTDEDHVKAAVEVATRATGSLDICVAAAGTGGAAPIVVTQKDEWQKILDTNLTGAFLTLKHAAAAMTRRGTRGSFVAISSIAGPLTHRYMAAYCVSKAGLEALVKNAADELGPAGIRVNGVRPGLVPTEMAAFLVETEDIRNDYLSQMPLGRLGTTEDIAAAVRYLAGPESDWVTGQILSVDGGHTLRRGPNLEPAIRALYGDAAADGRVE